MTQKQKNFTKAAVVLFMVLVGSALVGVALQIVVIGLLLGRG
jgi:hypothetical protein